MTIILLIIIISTFIIIILIIIIIIIMHLEHLPTIETKTLVGKTAVDDHHLRFPILQLVHDPSLQELHPHVV